MTMRAARSGPLLLLALAGTVQALCFAPGPLPAWLLSPLQIVTLAILVRSVWLAPSAREAGLRAWIFSMASFSVGLYWLTISMHLDGYMPLPLAIAALLALSAYLALFGGFAGWIAVRATGWGIGKMPGSMPCAPLMASLLWAAGWTLTEWLRATLLTGFPWLGTGYAHTDSWFAGWGAVTGVYGVTFAAAFTAAALACGLSMMHSTHRAALTRATNRSRAVRVMAVALGLLVIGGLLGRVPWSMPRGEPTAVRLVQGNIDQGSKFAPDQWLKAIRAQYALAAQPPATGKPEPAIVVLPETAIALFQHQVDPAIWQAWQSLARRQGSTIVMGAPLIDRADNRYTNSVIAIDSNTSLDALIAGRPTPRYDKHHLVPFGEFVPFGFRWFVDLMTIPLGDFGRGAASQTPFSIRDQSIAPNICYEDIFGEELLAGLRGEGPNQSGASILVNVSNLGWFGDSWALRQHWQMARMRAIETSRPVLRATNTGMTGAISPAGESLGQLPALAPGVIDITVQGQTGLTPYARLGNWPVLLLSAALLAWAWLRARRKQ